ncbi:MAG: hypothetical protein KZQ78_16475 [Candidatus Thiodiazotropha sp. (ex Ustalcina ferruginea)]|nr:hypothetical protein [Candidatus Thiodiazotropha sp. (ex Ustalcina ferruginea)]
MDAGSQSSDPRIEQFWTRYTQLLVTFRVPARAIPWYQRHIQAFIDDHPNTRLQAQTPENLERWFDHLGRQPQITEWRFRQKVDALRLLLLPSVETVLGQ